LKGVTDARHTRYGGLSREEHIEAQKAKGLARKAAMDAERAAAAEKEESSSQNI
jgi:hypothetical protein